jgi:hypothetical protein
MGNLFLRGGGVCANIPLLNIILSYYRRTVEQPPRIILEIMTSACKADTSQLSVRLKFILFCNQPNANETLSSKIQNIIIGCRIR